MLGPWDDFHPTQYGVRHVSNRYQPKVTTEKLFLLPNGCELLHGVRSWVEKQNFWSWESWEDFRTGPEYERRTSSPAVCSFRLPHSLQLPAQPLASFSCAYKREVAPLRETHQNYVQEKGDKVFGERSARLLTPSSRTPRTPMTTFLTTTSSQTSTTSSTTWLARMSTPSPVLLLLLSRMCSCSFC